MAKTAIEKKTTTSKSSSRKTPKFTVVDGASSATSERTETASKAKPRKKGVSDLDTSGLQRFNALRFLVIKTGGDLRLSDAKYFAKLLGMFEADADALVEYLNTGRINPVSKAAFRQAVVELWSSLQLHQGEDVNWKFVRDRLGTQGNYYLLNLG